LFQKRCLLNQFISLVLICLTRYAQRRVLQFQTIQTLSFSLSFSGTSVVIIFLLQKSILVKNDPGYMRFPVVFLSGARTVQILKERVIDMKTVWLMGLVIAVLMTSAYGQLVVKNNSDVELMSVDNTGDVVIGTAQQAGTLTVLGSTTTATLKITDGAASGRVLKSDASGNASWSTDLVDDADADPTNEKPVAGTAISVSDRTVGVKVDNSTIKVNGSDQLYADVSMTESDPVWSSDKAELRDNNSSTTPVNWLDIANRPSGLDDGDDNTDTDTQDLHFNSSTRVLSLDRGGSVTIPDNVNDNDHNPTNEKPVAGTAIFGF
jgi:hypothetical protein